MTRPAGAGSGVEGTHSSRWRGHGAKGMRKNSGKMWEGSNPQPEFRHIRSGGCRPAFVLPFLRTQNDRHLCSLKNTTK